jgi:iron-sulfur cluster repair protein YtfE (RIC family)
MKRSRIDPALTVNQIILRYPAAIAVMNEFGIDSCCGGGTSLQAAAQRDGLDLDALLTALEAIMPVEVA